MTVAESKKFKINDRVVCIKNTPEVQEGWVGVVFEVANRHISDNIGYDYCVLDDNKVDYYAFNEDELELLRASVELELPVKETIYISALDKQVSGNHYKDCGIQPIEYIHANNLNYFEGNAVKYITRHRKKNGKADIEKAIHYLELLLELEYKD